ncbi:MAG: hypothetical protein IK115_11055 [Lachnospiraceae bacterium]|nr:hypothetical protein [Lachnospiraceae bacterium]
MVDIDQILSDAIRRSECYTTVKVNEIEELLDTGLEKNEENIQRVAAEYLDDKGYARSIQNMDMAKKHITDSSAAFDTVRVRRVRRMEEDLLEEATPEELNRLANAALLDKLSEISKKLATNRSGRVEYAVEVVDEIRMDNEKSGGSLMEFVSFQTLLNRYAAQGFRVKSITEREVGNHGRLMMAGFSSTQKQTVIVFERDLPA